MVYGVQADKVGSSKKRYFVLDVENTMIIYFADVDKDGVSGKTKKGIIELDEATKVRPARVRMHRQCGPTRLSALCVRVRN